MAEIELRGTQMGLIACISYVIGNVVGSGIFITPTEVLKLTGSIGLSLVVWLFCGLISIIGGVAYIELGTGIPSDGGDFAYATHVGWQAVAFAFMWVSALLTYPASTAVQATTFGQYVVQGISPLVPMSEEWKVVSAYAIGFSLLIVCTAMNFFAIDKLASRFQIIVTTAKAAVLLVICGIGAHLFLEGSTDNVSAPFDNSNYAPGTLVMACYGGLWSYAGWDILNYGAPAVRNPRKNLSLSLLGGLVVVTVIYVFTNAAYCVVLGPERMMNSTAIAADFANETMGGLAGFIPFATALLLMGTLNANIFCTSRIMYEAARQGHLPPFLSCIHKESKSPRAALLVQLICSMLVSVVDVGTLINNVSFVMWAQKLVTMLALIKMRYSRTPMDKGVIRVPLLVSIVFLVCCVVLVMVPFVTETKVTIVGSVFVVSGLILYFIFVRSKELPSPINKLNNLLSRIFCTLLNCEVDVIGQREKVNSDVPRDVNPVEPETRPILTIEREQD